MSLQSLLTEERAETEPSIRSTKRREKPQIPLAADQPRTTQGKSRERVYVACSQCRSRKIRCDGARPSCYNCTRRVSGAQFVDCSYDPIPKRRGPDRTPGARQRRADADEPGGVKRRRRVPPPPPTSRIQTQHEKEDPSAAKDAPTIPLDPRSSVREILTSPTVPLPLEYGGTTSSSQLQFSELDLALPSYGPSSRNLQRADNQAIPTVGMVFPGAHTYAYPGEAPYAPQYDTPLIVPFSADAQSRQEGRGKDRSSNSASDRRYDKAYVSQEQRDWGYSRESFFSGFEHTAIGLRFRPHGGTEDITREPSALYAKKNWWDALLQFYIDLEHTYPLYFAQSQSQGYQQTVGPIVPGSPTQRSTIASHVRKSFISLFKSSIHWFAFFHAPTVLGSVLSPSPVCQVQPSLVLAFLAVAELLQSSELGRGKRGQARALVIREEAQAALERSWNSGWVDEGLAQAAWLLAFFEVCIHDNFSSSRSRSAMFLLDANLQAMNIMSIDKNDPNYRAFHAGGLPAHNPYNSDEQRYSGVSQPFDDNLQVSQLIAAPLRMPGCNCASLSLRQDPLTPQWADTPVWSEITSISEIRKESNRRLCWSTMALVSEQLGYAAVTRREGLDLSVTNPAEYGLLFNGDPLLSSDSNRDTIWSLHDRSALLWHGCIRVRADPNATPEDRLAYAVAARLEVDELERKLNLHNCGAQNVYQFQARDHLFFIRMATVCEFQHVLNLNTEVDRFLFRRQAEQWLRNQYHVALFFIAPENTKFLCSEIVTRPPLCFWLMSQISRALQLWEWDSSLGAALDCAKILMKPLEFLQTAWPCAEMRMRQKGLWERLADCCRIAGIELPEVPTYSLHKYSGLNSDKGV